MPDWRFAFVPVGSAVIEDTWDAIGLRGTGSHHVTASAARVPGCQLAAPLFTAAGTMARSGVSPLVTLAGMFLAAVPLGIVHRALDEFTALAASQARGPAGQPIGHDAAAQCELARAEAGVGAARAFLFDAIGTVWDSACGGDEPSLQQRGEVLLAAQQRHAR